MLLLATITPQAVLRTPNMQRIALPSMMAMSRMSYNTSARQIFHSPLIKSPNTRFTQLPVRPANAQRPLKLMTSVGLRPFSTTPLKPFKVTPIKPFAVTNGSQFSWFQSSRSKQIEKEAEEKANAMPVVLTEPAWPHPVYTEKQMNDIKIAHRETKNWSDWIALSAVRILRWSFDLATGYKHDKQIALGKRDAATPKNQVFAMTPEKWLIRFIFLESIAGVPGMVGGMVRHLHSLRALRRDNGWIETLLEEAYNERMHLLTFLKLREPGWFMRIMILGAQGIFFNGFFLSYLISPRTCHRFVGYLEEEAVITYTRAIADIDAGKLPEWEHTPAPNIAINYWRMPEGHRTMKDLLNYVRADEAKHREVNHTLANLAQVGDPNPFLAKYELPNKKPLLEEHPTKGLEYTKPVGWDREEVLEKVCKVLPKGHSMQA